MTDNESPKTKHLTAFSHSTADSNDSEASIVGPSVSQAPLYRPASPSSSTTPAPSPAPAPPYHVPRSHGWSSYRNTRPIGPSTQSIDVDKTNDNEHGHQNDHNHNDGNEDNYYIHNDAVKDKGKENDKDNADEGELNRLMTFQNNQLNYQNDSVKLHHDQNDNQNLYNFQHYQNEDQNASKETGQLLNIKKMNHHQQQQCQNVQQHQRYQQQQQHQHQQQKKAEEVEDEEEVINSAVVTNHQSNVTIVNNGFSFIDDELNRDFPQVGNYLNKEDLQDLLNDSNYFKATFLGLNQVKEMMDNQQDLIAANEALVERNFSLRDRLEQAREETAKAFHHTHMLMSTFRQLSKKQAEVYQPFGEQAIRSRLLTALHESDCSTENLANEFVNEGLIEDEDLFVKHYLEERKLFHRRSLIVERWSEGKILWE